MPSDKAAKCFADIVAAIDLIHSWVERKAGVEQAIFEDLLVRSAIERLIISEAAIRLDRIDPALAPSLAPEIDWPGIRGIGNLIRHRYDDLNLQTIQTVVSGRLGELRAACERAAGAAQS